MRFLMVAAALMLAGCASLDSDLQAADATCRQTGAMTLFVSCLNSAEEPVWQKQPPEDLADWRTFAASRMGLAQDLDSGKINATQFAAGAQLARATFRGDLAQDARRQMRAREQQADQQRAQDTLQQLEKTMPPPENGMSNDMGMNNNMNM